MNVSHRHVDRTVPQPLLDLIERYPRACQLACKAVPQVVQSRSTAAVTSWPNSQAQASARNSIRHSIYRRPQHSLGVLTRVHGKRASCWQPDMVVVNQGTNDWQAAASSDVFRPAYAKFLATIRAGYPNAKITALRPFGGGHAGDIQAEVQARQAADDKRVYYVDTTGWLGNGDYTDGTHPNEQGSQKAATALAAAIKAIGLP